MNEPNRCTQRRTLGVLVLNGFVHAIKFLLSLLGEEFLLLLGPFEPFAGVVNIAFLRVQVRKTTTFEASIKFSLILDSG